MIIALLHSSLSFPLLSFIVHIRIVVTFQNVHSIIVLGHFRLIQKLVLVVVDDLLPLEILVWHLCVPEFAEEVKAFVGVLSLATADFDFGVVHVNWIDDCDFSVICFALLLGVLSFDVVVERVIIFKLN